MYHDVYRSANTQRRASIVIFAEAPTVGVLHRDVCRSTNTQRPASIMMFAGAPTLSVLHVS